MDGEKYPKIHSKRVFSPFKLRSHLPSCQEFLAYKPSKILGGKSMCETFAIGSLRGKDMILKDFERYDIS